MVAVEGIDGGGVASTRSAMEMRTKAPAARLLHGHFTGDGDEPFEGDEGGRRRSAVKIKKMTDGGIYSPRGDHGHGSSVAARVVTAPIVRSNGTYTATPKATRMACAALNCTRLSVKAS